MQNLNEVSGDKNNDFDPIISMPDTPLLKYSDAKLAFQN